MESFIWFFNRPQNFTRFQNLTLDDIYHPRIIEICYRFTALFTTLNSLIYPIMIYVILTQSTRHMGNYKHLLWLQLTFSYAFNIITFIWHPIFFWPLILGFAASVFELPTTLCYLLLYFETSIVICMAIIQGYLIFYRIFAMFPDTFINNVYKNSKIFLLTLVIAFGLAFFFASSPFMIDDVDLEEVRELTKKDVPIVRTLTTMSSTVIGFYPKLSNGNIYILISLLAVIFFIIPVVFVMISITLTIRLQTLKLITSPQTYSMHRMLHKAMLVQLLIITLFLLMPGEFFVCLLFFEVKWGSMIVPFCLSIIHLHLFLESLNLLYFIKPYRRFVIEKLLNPRFWKSKIQAALFRQQSTANQGRITTIYGKRRSIFSAWGTSN